MASRKMQQLLAAGAQAPDFRLPLLAGGSESLAEVVSRGPVLLAFFKISCPVCQLTLPFLQRIHSAGRLQIYAVSQNDARDTREFQEDFGIGLPTFLDGEDGGFPVSNAFGISSVPTSFLIEADGRISRIIEGWRKPEIAGLGERAGQPVFRAGENVPEWKAG